MPRVARHADPEHVTDRQPADHRTVMNDVFRSDPSTLDPSLPTNIQVRDQLRALGYRCRLAFPGAMDFNGLQHLLSNEEFRALAAHPGPHPLDLTAHSVPVSTLNRRYTFTPPQAEGASGSEQGVTARSSFRPRTA